MTVETTAIAAPIYDSAVAVNVGARSLGRQAFLDTLSRTGARIGLVWIFVLLILAVFSPFLANSMPLAVKIDGQWSSPLIKHLAPVDVILLAAAGAALCTGIAIGMGRLRVLEVIRIVVWVVAVAVPLTFWPTVFEQYRHGELNPLHIFLWSLLAAVDLLFLLLLPHFSGLSSFGRSIVALGCTPLLALLALPVLPPLTTVYSQYRDLAANHRLQAVIWAPIPYSPNDFERDQRLLPPSARHWLGTEDNGGDILSWMMHAARIALSIGFISTGISVTVGIFVGGLMGYFAGIADILGMRLIEIVEAIPALVLLLTFCAFFGRNLYAMMAIIGLVTWPDTARFIRAEFLRLRKQDFVQAAVASGLPLRSIIFRHMLPNGITPVLVNTSFLIASAILLESTLSFLGLGLVDEPSWGQLLNQARAGGEGLTWWIATWPGLAIFLTVFSYNLIGEAVRDALDPKLLKRE
jgi:peptide/nickel transport system permease protein